MRINWGVYVYQLGGVRVSFRGCMIIVDLFYWLEFRLLKTTLPPPGGSPTKSFEDKCRLVTDS